MAINAAAVWEVRTTGTANGGGFFVPGGGGTDFSQQASPQYNFADLASSNGTTNPAVVTSVSHSFVTADVGNAIRVSAGTNWTAGWYQIVSVSGGAATLDRAVGTSASLTSGTYAVGGAQIFGSAQDGTWPSSVAIGNKIWVQAGSYTQTNSPSLTAAVTTSGYIEIEGYNTSRGDAPTTAANQPKWDLNGNTLAMSGVAVKYINLESSSGTISLRGGCFMFKCRLVNKTTSTGANYVASLSSGNAINVVQDCEAINYRGQAFNSSTNALNLVISGCYIHDSDIGVSFSAAQGGLMVINSIIAGCRTALIDINAAPTIGQIFLAGNTLYGNIAKNTVIGIRCASGSQSMRFINNLITKCATGISVSTAALAKDFSEYNNYFDNTTDVTNFTKGATDFATDPQITGVTQITGSGATSATNVLTDGSANFSTVTDNQDFLTIWSGSGTGIFLGKYLITAHTTTTLTVSSNITSAGSGSAISYEVTKGHNYRPTNTALIGTADPTTFFGGLTPNSLTNGGVQITSSGGAAGMLYMPNLEGT